MGRAWAELMKRLAYTCCVAQGGDWGSPISSEVACQAPAGLLGILINLPATVPSDVGATLAVGGPAPAGLSEKERGVFDALNAYRKANSSAYFTMLTVPPQTVGPDRLTRRPRSVDSRASGLRAVDVWQDPARTPTKDDVLDNVMLYEHGNLGHAGCTGRTADGALLPRPRGRPTRCPATARRSEITRQHLPLSFQHSHATRAEGNQLRRKIAQERDFEKQFELPRHSGGAR